ncbi:MAG: tRNA (N6-isopentenyl adenosine(37)-C2)-methylthiotransferase MiaB [Ruminococcaceae bacterium]|nr:tRNA (N6-isopentenyl adenosine(37)-C2)-methylthiotransferase MiaB [Oscillospiraceae bacterium]
MAEQHSRFVSEKELDRQRAFIEKIRKRTAAFTAEKGRPPYYHILTFGCQQNEADSEILSGLATEMGYCESEDPAQCELIVINTCAVREHAEKRALSITGQLKHLKAANPAMKIAICGCMVSQEHRRDDIKFRYPYVDILFGTDKLYRFPEYLSARLDGGKRSFSIPDSEGTIAEGLPVKRKNAFSSYVSVMYGCNNFCTYCIVPYVRGRERSRRPEDVVKEVKTLVEAGCREITLLGQNVNSYGKDLERPYDFSDLLKEIDAIEGDFWIRFMTSHPKDASKKLIDTIADGRHIAHQLHLPLQSGSDDVLKRMNRVYTFAQYQELAAYANERISDLAMTSDIIVGFPGESEDDFAKTLEALSAVRFDSIFSFLYSPRKGTPAASMEDQIGEAVKKERFERLLQLQNSISKEKNDRCEKSVQKVLVMGRSKTDDSTLTGRNEQNKLVHFKGSDSLIGRFVRIKITKAETFALFGELEED